MIDPNQSHPYEENQIQSYEQEDQTNPDPECTEGEPVLENNIKIITRVEKLTNLKQIVKIKNKLREFSLTQKVEKYTPYFQYPLADPVPIEITKVTQEPYNCKLIDETQTQKKSKFFLCKYRTIGKRTLSEYLKEDPKIQRILDQHDQLLKAITALSEEKKLIHHAITKQNIIVKDTDDIPVITNFKEAAFLYYEQEMNIDNFNTILTTATDIHCIEAHILLYLGKKKKSDLDINHWKTTQYDQRQHMEATQQHPQSQNQYPEYINNTYEEVYQNIMKTFSKWDIYSVTKLFSDILREIQNDQNKLDQNNQDNENNELLQIYQKKLTELLSKKTINLSDIVPIIQKPTDQLQIPEDESNPSLELS